MKFVIISIFFIPAVSLAQGVITDGQNTSGINDRLVDPPRLNVNQPRELNTDPQTDSSIQDSSQFTTPGGARGNADQSKSDSDSTQLLGLIMGASFSAICATPNGQWACAPAAMSFLDAALSGQNGGESVNFSTALQTRGRTNNTNGVLGGDAGPQSGVSPGTQEALAGLQDLEGKGISIDKKTGTVTTPDGEFSPQDFGSQQALEAKGFSPEQAESILDKLNQIKEQALKDVPKKREAIATTNTDGGSAAGGADVESKGDIEYELEEDEGSSIKDNRLPAAEASKLSRNFNGTPIGISLADLFIIVQKKYEKEDKNNAFFKREY